MTSLSALATPGVYVEEINAFPPSIAQAATAIPAFIGYTQFDGLDHDNVSDHSLHLKPTQITSLLEYESFFGKAQNEEKIRVTVKEDVTTKVISAVATLADSEKSKYNLYYAMQLFFANGGGACYIVSVNLQSALPGNLVKQDFLDGIDAVAAYDEPTLLVLPEAPGDPANYYEVAGHAIDQCAKLQDRFTIIDAIFDSATPVKGTTGQMDTFRTGFAKTDSLNYAAAYYPYLNTSINYIYDDTKVIVTLPDASTPSLHDIKDSHKACYYAVLAAIDKLHVTLPPSAGIAGIYAKVDGTRGVWKAPANISLSSVVSATDFITDEENGYMNIDATGGKSVNAIRSFTGKGILVWGARTLDGNSNEWRYIPVRRLFIMVEESTRKACAAFVFEPNDDNTWVKVRAMIENYLTNLWRAGALAGAKPEQAFYVRAGFGATMTQDDILNGRMIVEIGMAPTRPAEFIVLRFTQKMQEDIIDPAINSFS